MNRTEYLDQVIDTLPTVSQKEIKPNISSGAAELDMALGGGYLPGSINEIYGYEYCGKTSLLYHAIANAQKNGETCLLVNAERSYSREYAQQLGISTKDLVVLTPWAPIDASFLENFSLVAVDTITALDVPIDLSVRDNQTFIIANQLKKRFGAIPRTTTGGKKLKRRLTHRIHINSATPVPNGTLCSTLVTSKLSNTTAHANFTLRHWYGIIYEESVLDAAVKYGVLLKSGPYYIFENEKMLGKEKAISYLFYNKPELDRLVNQLGQKSPELRTS